MKILCECNDEWECEFSPPEESVFQLMVDSLRDGHIDRCRNCGFMRWINPLYENMMFDLREMNR